MKTIRNNNDGMALLLTMFFIAMALIILSTLSLRLINQRTHVEHFVDQRECYQGLEAGFAECLYELETGDDGMVGVDGWDPPKGTFSLPTFEDAAVTPLELTTMPGVEYYALAHSWSDDGIDNLGNGLVDDHDEAWTYSIHAFARNAEMDREIEIITKGSNVNVWENAIFAGNGQAGGAINGNVTIHGSVHLLGQNVVEGAPALSAIDLTGASLIHNNYDGMDADLRARIPDPPQTIWNGETVDTLNAKLRVKNGLVSMSGAAEVGSPDLFGNDYKETMDGTFVSDGWTGNDVIDDGDRGDPQSVYSDNKWDELYDLGDKVPFPLLTDDWRDPDTGAREWNDATGAWYSHEDFFNGVLLADPDDPLDGVHVGDIVLNVYDSRRASNNYYWNATTGVELVDSLPAVPPEPDDDYILFNAVEDVLEINGQITIDGNLSFVGHGNDTTINYSGRGALIVYGDVLIDVDLLTCNNGDPGDIAESYPVNNALGIMAAEDMTVGSTSQLSIMGAFYAQNQIISEKQTQIMGTFVSSYFDMGTNVPDIWQVPALADNLPMGMIGDYPILALDRISWREVGVTL